MSRHSKAKPKAEAKPSAPSAANLQAYSPAPPQPTASKPMVFYRNPVATIASPLARRLAAEKGNDLTHCRFGERSGRQNPWGRCNERTDRCKRWPASLDSLISR